MKHVSTSFQIFKDSCCTQVSLINKQDSFRLEKTSKTNVSICYFSSLGSTWEFKQALSENTKLCGVFQAILKGKQDVGVHERRWLSNLILNFLFLLIFECLHESSKADTLAVSGKLTEFVPDLDKY